MKSEARFHHVVLLRSVAQCKLGIRSMLGLSRFESQQFFGGEYCILLALNFDEEAEG